MLKKKNLAPEEKQFIEKRKDIVNLVFKHIEECEMLEKKRFSDKVANERKKLFTSPTKGLFYFALLCFVLFLFLFYLIKYKYIRIIKYHFFYLFFY